MPKYQEPRSPIPAELRRAVEVESGHACAIARCGEHTYLEIHHINENREDNRVENLVLLCDKHHKMAHAGVIDKKALREYKTLLQDAYSSALAERVRRLEELLAQGRTLDSEIPTASPSSPQFDPGLPAKSVTRRSQLMYLTLEQIALAKYERETKLLLERQPKFTRGEASVQLDAVRQDDDLAEDLIVEVRWLRKRYLDAPVWVRQVEAATSTYELITGRKARGVLIFVVPKETMKHLQDLPYTAAELEKLERKPEIVIYTYAELGFDPGALSAEVFASNLRPPTGAA
jgi:hypothetical protein